MPRIPLSQVGHFNHETFAHYPNATANVVNPFIPGLSKKAKLGGLSHAQVHGDLAGLDVTWSHGSSRLTNSWTESPFFLSTSSRRRDESGGGLAVQAGDEVPLAQARPSRGTVRFDFVDQQTLAFPESQALRGGPFGFAERQSEFMPD